MSKTRPDADIVQQFETSTLTLASLREQMAAAEREHESLRARLRAPTPAPEAAAEPTERLPRRPRGPNVTHTDGTIRGRVLLSLRGTAEAPVAQILAAVGGRGDSARAVLGQLCKEGIVERSKTGVYRLAPVPVETPPPVAITNTNNGHANGGKATGFATVADAIAAKAPRTNADPPALPEGASRKSLPPSVVQHLLGLSVPERVLRSMDKYEIRRGDIILEGWLYGWACRGDEFTSVSEQSIRQASDVLVQEGVLRTRHIPNGVKVEIDRNHQTYKRLRAKLAEKGLR
jgi:hypothetical protein